MDGSVRWLMTADSRRVNTGGRWFARVTRESNALDLDRSVFTPSNDHVFSEDSHDTKRDESDRPGCAPLHR